eukprot:6559941-Alexandrium_andersonii.AAC.1
MLRLRSAYDLWPPVPLLGAACTLMLANMVHETQTQTSMRHGLTNSGCLRTLFGTLFTTDTRQRISHVSLEKHMQNPQSFTLCPLGNAEFLRQHGRPNLLGASHPHASGHQTR